MDIVKKEYSYTSANSLCDIYACSWSPADSSEVKAVFQIAHGMAEHSEHYEDFAKFLCEKGYAVYINDHLGHGKSVKCMEDIGYFGEKDGWKTLLEDTKTLMDIAVSENLDKPIILFGNSIGSFIARSYSEEYGKKLAGAIYCATSGANPADNIAIKISEFVASRKGSKYRSEFINNAAFASYNLLFKREQPFANGILKETQTCDLQNESCNFVFTAAAYKDLMILIHNVSKKKWYKSIPYSLPILILSGLKDPVGDYGKGVKQVYKDLKKTGHNDVILKLYDGANHELLKEENYLEIYQDITDWVNSVIEKQ